MLDYKLLEALAAVVREGGFEKAARALHLTQSAVSQRVRALEEHLGQVVLARTQPPGLTPAGERLLRHVQEVEQLESELLDGIVPTGDALADRPAPVPVAVNADSLDTWFTGAARTLLEEQRIALELRLDDQDLTHELLRSGQVMGCVSAQDRAAQACRVDYLGCMRYRFLCSPAFARYWFPDGFELAAVRRAPVVVFNRKDRLHERLLRKIFRRARIEPATHYMPSSTSFIELITAGLAYGVMPDPQGQPLLAAGTLVDVAPGHSLPVELYWHCWNLRSALLAALTATIVGAAHEALPRTR